AASLQAIAEAHRQKLFADDLATFTGPGSLSAQTERIRTLPMPSEACPATEPCWFAQSLQQSAALWQKLRALCGCASSPAAQLCCDRLSLNLAANPPACCQTAGVGGSVNGFPGTDASAPC